MAITLNPKRNKTQSESDAAAFIEGEARSQPNERKRPIMIRIPVDLLKRIDRAATKIGISRSAFLVSSAAERLNQKE